MSIQELETKYKELGAEIQRLRKQPEGVWEPKMSEWQDTLDPYDSETWVLCFVSDYSSTARECVAWVAHFESGPYPFGSGFGRKYKYAKPVDLNIRY